MPEIMTYQPGREPKDILVNAGVPAKYCPARLKDFPTIQDETIEWHRGGFFLQGNPGIGKTYLAAALAARRLRHDHKATLATMAGNLIMYSDTALGWISAPELLMNIRATFGSNAKGSESEVVRHYCAFSLLVLDDLGAEKISDWSASALYLILSKRDAELRDTIITSNASIPEIAKWEPRIASRLASMAKIKLPDVDRRLS